MARKFFLEDDDNFGFYNFKEDHGFPFDGGSNNPAWFPLPFSNGWPHKNDRPEIDEGNPFEDLTYRTIDGSGNNADGYGTAHTVFTTIAGSAYSDGYNSPSGQDRPNAREISNALCVQETDIPSVNNASNFLWMWGQFLDHDIDLTAEGHAESFNIICPIGDPHFDPYYTGSVEISLNRSAAAEGTGTDIDHPRQQMNEITAFIDASNVYGSDAERAAALRDGGGYLKLTADGYLPFNEDGLPNANANPFLTSEQLFLAGDVRANENVALTSMHTVLAREHNRLVDELKAQYPDMSAEELYQNAKAIVEAQMQVITYNEFLPLIVGKEALSAYEEYNPAIDPQITNEFATAAFRLGHSMLSATIARMQENGTIAEEGNLSLQHAFFNPGEILQNGFDTLLRGQAATHSQAIDTFIVDDVRNFLFGPPGAGGFDLVSLNIQRGRDHGLPDFNSVREAYGLKAYTDFSQITSDPELAAKLEETYQDINNIDLFIGGLAENNAEGAVVGETFQAILAHQFTALRDGDQFWYQSRFDGELLEDLESTTLSDIIQRNTDIEYLQENVFITSDRIGGTENNDILEGSEKNDLMIGFGGSDRLYGHNGDDALYGGAGRDLLHGGDGNDLLAGGEGTDHLKGDAGDDILIYDKDDHYRGGSGFDTLRFDGNSGGGFFDLGRLEIDSGIEALDFNNGLEDTVSIDIDDILTRVDGGDLFILGDDGQDRVLAPQFGHDLFRQDNTVAFEGVEYAVYSLGGANIHVELGLIIDNGINIA